MTFPAEIQADIDALGTAYRYWHRIGNVLGFCPWCGICCDCHPHHDEPECCKKSRG